MEKMVVRQLSTRNQKVLVFKFLMQDFRELRRSC